MPPSKKAINFVIKILEETMDEYEYDITTYPDESEDLIEWAEDINEVIKYLKE